MAYLSGAVVPGLCLYSSGRQSAGMENSASQHPDRVGVDRNLAWERLEFPCVGHVLWSASDSRKMVPAVCGHLYAVLAAVIGMTVFALEELPEGLSWIGMLFGSTGRLWNAEALWLLSNDGFLFLICLVGAAGLWKKPARWPVLWFLSFFLSIAYLVDAAYNPFLYFRF